MPPSTSPSEARVLERNRRVLPLGLQLYDGYNLADRLLGDVQVRARDLPDVPYAKVGSATFLFFEVPDGKLTLEVRASPDTPYYLAADIEVTLPMSDPGWPVYPERSKADTALHLRDPNQPQAFRDQLGAATLQPDLAYPFPAGATVVRGSVWTRNIRNKLEGARVRRIVGGGDDDLVFTTKANGEFVLFYPDLPHFHTEVPGGGQPDRLTPGEKITLRVSHPSHSDVDHELRVPRGKTTVVDIKVGP